MAEIYPSTLPEYVLKNPLRSAEIRVYKELAKQLDEHFHVFYSSPWIGTMPDGMEIDGEADFIIAHAQKGMLVIEVKGGRVAREEDTGQWKSKDRNGVVHNIKDPVDQARTGKHELMKKLKERKDWKTRFINLRHGVILTDSLKPSEDLGADMPLQLFAFAEDMDALDEYVERRFNSKEVAQHGKVKPLGPDGINALIQLLSKSIELKVDLERVLEQDRADIERLTEEQYVLLKDMEENLRMTISGAAGTGKTTLAAQKAIYMADENKDVLLVCFNEPLAKHLQSKLKDYKEITVSTFHTLCREFAVKAGIPLPHNKNMQEYFSYHLPECLQKAIDNSQDLRFDAVIVDEGQDFMDHWFIPIEDLLRNSKESVFYIFYDNNQQLNNSGISYIRTIPVAKHRLSRNLRNTRQIFDLANRFYSGLPVQPAGPKGQKIRFILLGKNPDPLTVLREQLGILINQEKIPEHHITVLVPDKYERDRLTASGYIGRLAVSTGSEPELNHVTVESVRRFKGLDSRAIIIFHPEKYLDTTELLYVASTRAQVRLVIIGEKDAIQFLKNKLKEA